MHDLTAVKHSLATYSVISISADPPKMDGGFGGWGREQTQKSPNPPCPPLKNDHPGILKKLHQGGAGQLPIKILE